MGIQMFCPCGKVKNFTTEECRQGLHQSYVCSCQANRGIASRLVTAVLLVLATLGVAGLWLLPIILKGISS